jgi:hypothetical protein
MVVERINPVACSCHVRAIREESERARSRPNRRVPADHCHGQIMIAELVSRGIPLENGGIVR